MQRIRISINLEPLKHLVVLIAVGILHLLTTRPFTKGMLVAGLALILITVILFYIFHHSKTVEHDDDHLYITGPKTTGKISLKDITSIKLTSAKINQRSMWRICYTDGDGKKGSVTILPHLQQFYKFQGTVKKRITNSK